MDMDRPSIMFAHILDGMVVEQSPYPDEDGVLWLVCQECHENVCQVEDNDTLRVLLNTALAHQC